ncbi:MAG TPA: hypothetical protein VMT34_08970, partial [Aggregatilineales bacterium]|nr:hypothetical protein [Aggregatilineales bacterium]
KIDVLGVNVDAGKGLRVTVDSDPSLVNTEIGLSNVGDFYLLTTDPVDICPAGGLLRLVASRTAYDPTAGPDDNGNVNVPNHELTLHFSEIDRDKCQPPKKVSSTAEGLLNPCMIGKWRVTSIPSIHAAGLTITYTPAPDFTFDIAADGSVAQNLHVTGTTYTSSVEALVAVEMQGATTAHVHELGRIGGFSEIEVLDANIISFKATATVKGRSFDLKTNLAGTTAPVAHSLVMTLCVDHNHLRYISQTSAGNFRVDTTRITTTGS